MPRPNALLVLSVLALALSSPIASEAARVRGTPHRDSLVGVGNGRTEAMRYYTGSTALRIGDTTAAALHLTRASEALRGKPLDAIAARFARQPGAAAAPAHGPAPRLRPAPLGMREDAAHHCRVGDERDDRHRASAARAHLHVPTALVPCPGRT